VFYLMTLKPWARPGAFFYSRRQLFANADIAASRVASQPCVGVRSRGARKRVSTSMTFRLAPHWPWRCGRQLANSCVG